MKNNKILILGGAGFIGFYLAEYLKDNNQIEIIDDLSKIKKKDKEFNNLIKHKNIKFLKKNILKINLKYTKRNYDYIFDAAASVGVKNVINNSYHSLQNNINITLKAIDIAKKQNNLKKVIFFSSSEVYDGGGKYYNTKYPSSEKLPITLSNILDKRTVYMASKIIGEILYINSDLPFIINRFHNIYGPRMGYKHVIPELIKKFYSSQGKIEIVSPNHSRTFCYYKDAIKIILMLTKSKSRNKIYNVGLQRPEITIKKLAYIILKVLNLKRNLIFKQDNHNSPKRRCPNMKLTNKIIGKIEYTKLEDGIRETFNYFKTKNGKK